MITIKQINTNINRLKSNKHTNKRRLSYWLNQKEHYIALIQKRGK